MIKSHLASGTRQRYTSARRLLRAGGRWWT
jgi:hypothetical protein